MSTINSLKKSIERWRGKKLIKLIFRSSLVLKWLLQKIYSWSSKYVTQKCSNLMTKSWLVITRRNMAKFYKIIRCTCQTVFWLQTTALSNLSKSKYSLQIRTNSQKINLWYVQTLHNKNWKQTIYNYTILKKNSDKEHLNKQMLIFNIKLIKRLKI